MMIIGIGGTSRSGKTSLANALGELLDKSVVIHQDEFNAPGLPTIRDHIDWEIPEAVDYAGIIDAIKKYSDQFENIIVEGILIFANEALNSMFNRRILLILDEQTFLKRKNNDLRWGQEPEWYVQHIWDSHLKYGYPNQESDYLLITATSPADPERVINYIQDPG